MTPTDPEAPHDDGPEHAQGVPSLYQTAWRLYLGLAIVAVVWLGWSRGGPLPLDLFAARSTLASDLLWGVGVGLALLALWTFAAWALDGPRQLEGLMAEMLGPLDGAEVLALALISGFAEEIFFRGAMQQSWGLWPTVVVFALLHVGPSRVFLWWTSFAAVAGGLFGWLVIFRGTLLPAIVAHVLVNGINLYRLRAKALAVPHGVSDTDD